ncbi:MAG: LysR substrate-binding domain-containing protein [Sedimentitalea sp.]|uniref:LysR substrate-binding domain-containing protein n=1 Tax=Sedimentitalea sp. TaxID=2048915 RepID=UPI003267F32A
MGQASRKGQWLSVGALPTASTELLPQAVLLFRQDMPHVRLQIMTGPNWLLFNQLREGALNLVVGRMPERETATGITFQQLYIEDVVLVCRPGHHVLEFENPEEGLASFDLVLPPAGAVIAPTVQRYLVSIGLPEMRGAIETVALPVGRKIVGSSDALWFISRGVVADEVADGSLVIVSLKSPLLSGPVGTSFSQSAPINLERSVLIDCLKKVATQS